MSRMEKAKTRLPGNSGENVGANKELSDSYITPEKPKNWSHQEPLNSGVRWGLKTKVLIEFWIKEELNRFPQFVQPSNYPITPEKARKSYSLEKWIQGDFRATGIKMERLIKSLNTESCRYPSRFPTVRNQKVVPQKNRMCSGGDK